MQPLHCTKPVMGLVPQAVVQVSLMLATTGNPFTKSHASPLSRMPLPHVLTVGVGLGAVDVGVAGTGVADAPGASSWQRKKGSMTPFASAG